MSAPTCLREVLLSRRAPSVARDSTRRKNAKRPALGIKNFRQVLRATMLTAMDQAEPYADVTINVDGFEVRCPNTENSRKAWEKFR